MDQPPPTVDELLDELRRAGQRTTTARRAVLEELLAAGDHHLTADELARRVRARHPAIHLSTIYRTLDALTDAGLLTPAPFADQPTTYHLHSDVHHHAVCTNCGETLVLPPSALRSLRHRLLADHGFHADPQHLTITGRCRRCAES